MAEATATKKTAEKDASAPYAVFETGGKQYQASVGQVVKIEKIKGDHKEGDKVTFDKVLLSDDGKATKLGDPYLSGAKVEAEITEIGRNKKVNVVKYKAKSRYHKKRGHRQPYFKVKVAKI